MARAAEFCGEGIHHSKLIGVGGRSSAMRSTFGARRSVAGSTPRCSKRQVFHEIGFDERCPKVFPIKTAVATGFRQGW
jgi:hypothetical protein